MNAYTLIESLFFFCLVPKKKLGCQAENVNLLQNDSFYSP